MKEKRSRLIVGVGVLCFVGVMAVWLASSGDRAIADADRVATITKSVSLGSSSIVDLKGITKTKVTFAQSEGVVHRLSVYVNIKSQDARKMKVYLTSPSGTKVLLVDGANSNAVKKDGLEGWFGTDGLPTAQSLAAFAGEAVTGAWYLTVNSKVAGKLTKWSLTADLSPNTKMAGMETYGEYDGGGGCDCRVSGTPRVAGGVLAGLFLLAFVVIRRRR